MYEQVEDKREKREKFARDPVPNRHAAMHGLVSYSTHKHSMNMLILTDYVFEILPPITVQRSAGCHATATGPPACLVG